MTEPDGFGSAPRRLVGRDDTVEHVAQLVRRPGVRLVTVTGRSGVGKTAVAAAVARRIEAEEGLGVLRTQVDRHAPRAGADEVAAALSLPSDGAAGPPPSGRRRVVLLDGLEAVPGAAAPIADALAAEEGLSVLVTSIVPLALPGEHVVRLEPLGLPEPGAAADRADAVRLLVERIHEASGPHTRVEVATAAALAHRLDGLPLALELAAARCAELSVDEVLRQVDQLGPAQVLDGDQVDPGHGAGAGDTVGSGGSVGPSGGEPHHRSLRSTILWSYQLLDERQRRMLRRLAVCAGPFDRSTAAALSGAGPDDLDRLVDTGLVRRSTAFGDPERFELVPSVALVARELLDAAQVLVDAQDLHAEHHLASAAAAAPRLRSAATPDTRRALLAELDDIVAAARHLEDRGRPDDALRLVTDLSVMWEESSAAALASRLLDALLVGRRDDGSDADENADADTDVQAWALAAMVAVWGQRGIDRYDEIGDGLGRSLARAREHGSTTGVLMGLRSAVAWQLLEGRPDAAGALAEEGLALAETSGDPWFRCQFLGWCAAARTMGGDTDAARLFAAEGRDLALAQGDTVQLLRLSHILVGIGGADASSGSTPLDEDALVALARRVDDPHAEGVLQVGAAVRSVAGGDITAAAQRLLSALDVGRRRGLWYVEELAMLATVVVASAGGRYDDAARLHGAMVDLLPALALGVAPEAMQVYELTVDQARRSLGDQPFERSVAAGRLLDWEQATLLAAAVGDELAHAAAPAPAASTDAAPLSRRQAEVLVALADGRTNKEIAADLGMRPKTVMHHTSEIYRRLQVRNRTEAVAEAQRRGLLPPPG